MKYGDIIKFNGKLGEVVTDDKNNFLFHPAGFGSYYYNQLQVITEGDITETTQEEKIEYLKQEFVWGEIINTYIIGEYVIFEFIESYTLKNEGKEVRHFHAYINYKDISISYNSLDYCLIGTIAYKYDGANSQAAKFFERMINLK
jgi:hypothetical protein